MRDLLVILNPRRIPAAIRSLEALDIDKVWVRNHTLREVRDHWPEVQAVIDGYDWAWIISDDVIVDQAALDLVRELAPDHPVVTGYCPLAIDDPRVMLTRKPLGPQSVPDAYSFYTLADLVAAPDVVPTWFAGFALTGMSAAMWAKYPFAVESGDYAADFNLCKRLEADGVPIVAHRGAYVEHLKDHWLYPRHEGVKRLLCGVEPASIDVEVRA